MATHVIRNGEDHRGHLRTGSSAADRHRCCWASAGQNMRRDPGQAALHTPQWQCLPAIAAHCAVRGPLAHLSAPVRMRTSRRRQASVPLGGKGVNSYPPAPARLPPGLHQDLFWARASTAR